MKLLPILALAGLAAAGSAHAECPPLSVYQISGVSLRDGTLTQANQMLFQGTAWKVETAPLGSDVRLSLRNVGGPLDKVLNAIMDQAGNGKFAISSTRDTTQCIVHVNVASLAPPPVVAAPAAKPAAAPAFDAPVRTASATRTPPAVPPLPDKPMPTHPATTYAAGSSKPVAQALPPAPADYTLPAHTLLSRALTAYVKTKGWTLKWNVSDDYMIDAPVPIPDADNVIEGVSYVINAYKQQGGLLGATALFAKPNHVVAIIPTSAANQDIH